MKDILEQVEVAKLSAQRAEGLPCDRKRILIVDDEALIQRLFEMVLSWELPDCKIDVVSNGVEALHAFSERHHAVLLMDLHMPVMDGQAAFREIQSRCRTKNWEMPAVVFCTGYAPPASLTSVLAANGTHCLLSKPVSNEVLIDAVKSRLQS